MTPKSGLLKEMLIHNPDWPRGNVRGFIGRFSFCKFLKYPFLTFILSHLACLSKWWWNRTHSALTLDIRCRLSETRQRKHDTCRMLRAELYISMNLAHSRLVIRPSMISFSWTHFPAESESVVCPFCIVLHNTYCKSIHVMSPTFTLCTSEVRDWHSQLHGFSDFHLQRLPDAHCTQPHMFVQIKIITVLFHFFSSTSF